MRYFIVTYYRRPSGQMDEVASVSKRLRNRDLEMAGVILDFQNQQVCKCSIGDQIGDRDWQRVRDYYHRHYPDIIRDLESTYEKPNNPS